MWGWCGYASLQDTVMWVLACDEAPAGAAVDWRGQSVFSKFQAIDWCYTPMNTLPFEVPAGQAYLTIDQTGCHSVPPSKML